MWDPSLPEGVGLRFSYLPVSLPIHPIRLDRTGRYVGNHSWCQHPAGPSPKGRNLFPNVQFRNVQRHQCPETTQCHKYHLVSSANVFMFKSSFFKIKSIVFHNHPVQLGTGRRLLCRAGSASTICRKRPGTSEVVLRWPKNSRRVMAKACQICYNYYINILELIK